MISAPSSSGPVLDEHCDRIIAALTRRLAAAARSRPRTLEAFAAHDLLVPVLRPDLLDSEQDAAARLAKEGVDEAQHELMLAARRKRET